MKLQLLCPLKPPLMGCRRNYAFLCQHRHDGAGGGDDDRWFHVTAGLHQPSSAHLRFGSSPAELSPLGATSCLLLSCLSLSSLWLNIRHPLPLPSSLLPPNTLIKSFDLLYSPPLSLFLLPSVLHLSPGSLLRPRSLFPEEFPPAHAAL